MTNMYKLRNEMVYRDGQRVSLFWSFSFWCGIIAELMLISSMVRSRLRTGFQVKKVEYFSNVLFRIRV